jgi:serine/threonine protein kinase
MAEASTLEDLQPNSQLGHYTVLSHVAEGGMGHVYKGFDTSLQREVAIKVLKPEFAMDSKQARLFWEEAQNIAALRHQHIVPIYFVGQQGELLYFVMAYIEGSSLEDWILAGKPMTLDEATWVLNQAIEGLNEALSKNIVHLDIKPSNFLVEVNGNIFLTDFGLARSLSAGMEDRECFGTPAYISPEQILNKPTDQRSDIYSLGATMFHLLTCKAMYEAENIEDILKGHLESPFPYEKAEAAGLPPGWIYILDKMTQKDPMDRFQNYAELGAALNKVNELKLQHHNADETKFIPVPNRGNSNKAYLNGLLSDNCASWAESGPEAQLKRSRSEIQTLIKSPIRPFSLESLNPAIKELSQGLKSDIPDLVKAIELMPNVQNYILALAQTSFFLNPQDKTNLEQAVEAVGIKLTSDLILTALMLKKDFKGIREFNWTPFWHHSIAVAVASALLVDMLYFKEVDTRGGLSSIKSVSRKYMTNFFESNLPHEAYRLGLFHDIGKILLSELAPYTYYQALRRALEEQKPLEPIEREMMSMDHHEAGLTWANKYNLDNALKDAIQFHDDISHKSSKAVCAVALANQLVKRQGIGYSGSAVIEYRNLSQSVAWKTLLDGAPNNEFTPDFLEIELLAKIGQLPQLEI